MEPPQLRCAEAPMRTSLGAPVPMFVDESVGNIRIQECQELGGASRRKRRVHGPANYSLKLYLSAKNGEQHISHTTCLLHVTYTETRNTLFQLLVKSSGNQTSITASGISSQLRLHSR